MSSHHSSSHIYARTIASLQGTTSPTVEKESFQRSLLAAQLANKSNGKKAVDAPPVNIGWDSHQAVVSIMQYMRIWTCRIAMFVPTCRMNQEYVYTLLISIHQFATTHVQIYPQRHLSLL